MWRGEEELEKRLEAGVMAVSLFVMVLITTKTSWLWDVPRSGAFVRSCPRRWR